MMEKVARNNRERHRYAVPDHRDMILRAPLGPVGRVEACEIAAALDANRAAIEDQVADLRLQPASCSRVDVRA
jgi:hypothetical protein